MKARSLCAGAPFCVSQDSTCVFSPLAPRTYIHRMHIQGRQPYLRGVAASRLPQVPVAPVREALHRNDSVHARPRRLHHSPRGNVVDHCAGRSSGHHNPDGGATGSSDAILKLRRSGAFCFRRQSRGSGTDNGGGMFLSAHPQKSKSRDCRERVGPE